MMGIPLWELKLGCRGRATPLPLAAMATMVAGLTCIAAKTEEVGTDGGVGISMHLPISRLKVLGDLSDHDFRSMHAQDTVFGKDSWD